MKISTNSQEQTGTIYLSGRFDFSAYKDFKDNSGQLVNDSNVKIINIDLSDATYLDSSALGMLMLLRENALTAHKTVRIVNCSGSALDILTTANLQKQFEFR